MAVKPARIAAVLAFFVVLAAGAAAEEPPLPDGLAGDEPALSAGLDDEPALPAGLGDEPALPAGLDDGPALPDGLAGDEPALPDGLDNDSAPPEVEPREPLRLPFEFGGFWETRGGLRTQQAHRQKDATLGESRLHVELDRRGARGGIGIVADFLYDPVLDSPGIDLEQGRGWIDLRGANAYFPLGSFIDVKIGRQVLTWGTGDLRFINDLFPKDWVSFLLGRDMDYLKAPSDAAKVSIFGAHANLDIVYTPRFDPDRYISGERASYYNANLGGVAGRNAIVQADVPDRWFNDDELAARLYRNFGAYEAALYGYHGRWKSPAGQDPIAQKATFPRLSVYGASVRGPVRRGIGNIEIGYYNSEQDRNGTDPLVRNSEFRALIGYEQDVPQIERDFTVAMQYYLEHMMNHASYTNTLPPGQKAKDANWHVFTLRLTKLSWQQNLRLSLFTFYSPNENDAHFRPSANYKIDDHWTVELGANIFTGADDHTFFGQFEDNTSVYAALRYGF